MSNESRIGLMAVIVFAIAIWGYKFLQGKNLLSTSTALYIEYDDVTELPKSAPVLKNGFQVGVVSDIYLKPDNPEKIIVAIDIDNAVKVPKNTRAVLLSLGVMSGRGIELEFSQPCSGADCAQSGDYLQGVTKGLLGSMVDPSEVPAYMDQLNEGIQNILDTLKEEMNEPGSRDSGIGKIAKDMEITMANLKMMTGQINGLLAANSKSLNRMLTNMASITGNLADNNEQITTLMANASKFSGQLAESDIKGTVQTANGTLEETQKMVTDLKATLATLDQTFTQANTLLTKINAGEGTLGLLVKDEALYNNLNKTSREMELLLQDVRLHPKRYTRILSKKEKPYEVPQDDPAKQ